MGRKYIKQRTSSNFVYPNNSLEEYDVEIVHDINNNSVSGTTTSITASSVSSSGITFSFDYTWAQNSAEPFVFTGTSYSFLSVHLIEPNTIYYKPWRLVNAVTGAAASTKSGTVTFTVTPSQMGVSSFDNGVYSFEIRMIGKRAIFPICQNVTVSTIPVPSPTPTVTPTITPTPTSTPAVTPTPTSSPGSSPTPTPTVTGYIYKSGATINVTDTGYIIYDTNSANDVYEYIGSLGVVTLTACIDCNTIEPGYPFPDVAEFTIIQCGSGCSGAPTPSPTPTGTNTSNGHYIMTDCQTFQERYTQSVAYGTFNSGDRVEGNQGYFYVITGFTPSSPDPSLIFFVTATGQFGCP